MEHRLYDAPVEILDESECRALLAKEPVGRVAYVTNEGKPMIVPVDFVISDDLVMFRSDPGDKLAHVPLRRVCFEVDGAEGPDHAWSVVIQGLARDVTSALGERYERLRGTELPSFAPLLDPHWVAIEIEQITGRRLSR